ncbi:hypothetical protein DPMN_111281 [Dreissena polymorpha]|uniref:Uncharacterized protein n=1 Tax=Dreissena polymorpha TaxID=45954 RepID=A0A9D4KE83_DREPO|nr:hypothetical protein DPMN_111281 [Dreissena polymorpha]
MDTRLSCPLCHEPIGDERPFSKLSEKGCQGIRLASKHHATNVTVSPGDMVHISSENTLQDLALIRVWKINLRNNCDL